jgi:CO/xanthine dehydrogenase Mo-binding subunit
VRAVGRSIPRPDLPDKLCGKALYLDDHPFPGCLHGVTVRSEVAYGRLRRVVFEAGFPWEEFAVVVAKDIPGQNRIQAVEADQPALAEGWILHPFQPVALLAHPRREAAYEALRRVRVECEPLDPVLTIEDSLALKAVLRPPDNVFKSVSVDKGDIVAGFAAAHAVVEGEYRVPHQEQAYLEPNAAAAWFEADGTLRVLGSLQCPFYVHKALARLFGLPPGKVRVAQAATGGAFGGKEDYPSILAAHAALLAWKSGKAV